MIPPNLSFEISSPTLDLFLYHWASRYRDENKDVKFYDPYIGKTDLKTDEAALKELFKWKNGGKISEAKLASIHANYFQCWTEDADLESRFLCSKEKGGPIWNIFYLHCRFPDRYPIYDQHAHRAMVYIQEHTIREDLSTKAGLVYDSYKHYRCFVTHIRRTTGNNLRTIDRAFYTFGQFLKLAKPFWNPAQHQP